MKLKMLKMLEKFKTWIKEKWDNLKFWVEDKYEAYLEYGSFKMWFIRKFLGIWKPWSDEKILKTLINKQYDIVGATKDQPMQDKYKTWYDYLIGEKPENWYTKYHFTLNQEDEMKFFYYKIMKLHKDHWGFPSDYRIFRSYPWESLQWFFGLKRDEELKKASSIEDLDHHSQLWYKILKFIFPEYLEED